MIRLVLDTNVFLSGIFWSGPPSKLLDAWLENKIKMVFSVDILQEYERVGQILSKKYKGVDVKPFIDLVIRYGEMYSPVKLKSAVTCDPYDEMFIATALAGKCKLIVSGDSDLLDVDGYADINIVKPGPFVRKYLS